MRLCTDSLPRDSKLILTRVAEGIGVYLLKQSQDERERNASDRSPVHPMTHTFTPRAI